jgi:hypothetical protein
MVRSVQRPEASFGDFMYLDTLKALQALEVIRRAHRQDTVSPSRLLMLLYLCERDSWRIRGIPLLVSSIVATKTMGPVHSIANFIVKDAAPRDTLPQELAHDEITLIQAVTLQHMRQSEAELLELTTSLPEWESRRRNDWGCEIPYSTILASLGFEAEEAANLLAKYPELGTGTEKGD